MIPPGQINTQEDFIDAILNVIDVDLPMRNFTLRFYSHFIQDGNLLNDKQKFMLIKTYQKSLQTLHGLVDGPPEPVSSPYNQN